MPKKATKTNWFSTKKQTKLGLILAATIILLIGAYHLLNRTQTTTLQNPLTAGKYIGKKILYIDSYHQGYEWSDGITEGVTQTLKDTGADLKIHRMDTKRNTDEAFKQKAGTVAKQVIEDFDPDVVITSDDNAFKYLVKEYYQDSDLPFVYSGLNWDSSLYNAPYPNTVGMVEVSLTEQIINYLTNYASGSSLGYLSSDTATERKNLEYYDRLFNITFDQAHFVSSFDEWKDSFLKLQDQVDIIIFENNAGIEGWDETEAENFTLENTKVPVGTTNPWIMNYSLLGLTKVPQEQGEWSAQTALEILDGSDPAKLEEVTNKQGKLYLNLKQAEKLDVLFDPVMIKNAEIIQ